MKNRLLIVKGKALYAKAPSRIFKVGLSPFDTTIFFYLTSLDEEVNPSVVMISEALNISFPTVVSCLNKLQEANMIHKYHQGSIRDVNKYEFIDWRLWKKIKR